jgi:dihydroorotate dehydrogenase electron transfer subunit
MYTNDGTKLLPRPISICEIDKTEGALRVVYRVTGENTGTKRFSECKAGDIIPVIGPLGNGFPLEKAEGKKAFLRGGGIGVPPILELSKQLNCEKQIVMGYRDANTFLKEQFDANGSVYISTEDGSVGTKGNVMDAIRENGLSADIIYACGPTPMLRAIKNYAEENGIECYISLEEKMACGIGACLACVCKSKDVDHHSHVNNKRVCKDGPVFNVLEVEL